MVFEMERVDDDVEDYSKPIDSDHHRFPKDIERFRIDSSNMNIDKQESKVLYIRHLHSFLRLHWHQKLKEIKTSRFL